MSSRLSQVFETSPSVREAREAEAWSNLAERSVTPSSPVRGCAPHESEVEATGPKLCIVRLSVPSESCDPAYLHQAQSRL